MTSRRLFCTARYASVMCLAQAEKAYICVVMRVVALSGGQAQHSQSILSELPQRESKNLSTHEANTFEHVYLFQEMRVPSARRIRECESLLNGADVGVPAVFRAAV